MYIAKFRIKKFTCRVASQSSSGRSEEGLTNLRRGAFALARRCIRASPSATKIKQHTDVQRPSHSQPARDLAGEEFGVRASLAHRASRLVLPCLARPRLARAGEQQQSRAIRVHYRRFAARCTRLQRVRAPAFSNFGSGTNEQSEKRAPSPGRKGRRRRLLHRCAFTMHTHTYIYRHARTHERTSVSKSQEPAAPVNNPDGAPASNDENSFFLTKTNSPSLRAFASPSLSSPM